MGNRDADALTPREHEVLGLVRLGLTNEEIAERLGITLDGAKYHVSQILSKLGVATREEAAALTAEPERRRWWAALPLAAKAAGAALVVAAVTGLGVLAWGVLETEGESPSSSAQEVPNCELTVESVIDCWASASQRPNSVLHIIGRQTTFPGETSDIEVEANEEHWIDRGNDRARSTLVYDTDDADILVSSITTDETEFLVTIEGDDTPRSVRRPRSDCTGHSTPIPTMTPCPEWPEGSNAAVVEDVVDGRPVVVLSLESRLAGEGRTYTETLRYTIDAGTYLAIAAERVDSASDTGEFFRRVSRWENEFIDADSLPADFFDLASIGYIEASPTP
jgi:DNA-binding CsgD family transcriptional regulator